MDILPIRQIISLYATELYLTPEVLVSVPLLIADQISNTPFRATEVHSVDSYEDIVPQDKNARKVETSTRESSAKISAEVILQVLIPKQNLQKMKIRAFSRTDS